MAKSSPDLVLPEQVLVNRRQAAHMLGCSESRIYRLEAEGVLKPIKFGGLRNAVARYRKTDIEALANDREPQS